MFDTNWRVILIGKEPVLKTGDALKGTAGSSPVRVVTRCRSLRRVAGL